MLTDQIQLDLIQPEPAPKAKLRPAPSDAFDAALNAFLDDPGLTRVDFGTIKLLARSPSSPVAARLWSRLPEIAETGAFLTVVLLERPSEDELAAYARSFPAGAMRVIEDPKKVEGLHEQLTLGGHAWWCGGLLADTAVAPSTGKLEIVGKSGAAAQRASGVRSNFGLAWRYARAAAAVLQQAQEQAKTEAAVLPLPANEPVIPSQAA
jgi:hypothetical protein